MFVVPYITRHLLGVVPTLFVIVTISFFITRFAPGNPFLQEKAFPESVLRALEKQYGLDQPVLVQYGLFLKNLLRGDLGGSYIYRDATVVEILKPGIGVSFTLGTLSLVVVLSLGLFLGLVGGYYQNKWPDYLASGVAMLGIAIPVFVVGPLLMYALAIILKWLPTSGWPSRLDQWPLVIMPVITLSAYYVASVARIFRSSVIEVLKSDFVRTAHAKGLAPRYILLHHVLKPALLPVVSYLGPVFANLIVGATLVERIFRIPGLGGFLVNASLNRDYPVIIGMVLIYSSLIVIFNLMVDVFYAFLDPRITYDK